MEEGGVLLRVEAADQLLARAVQGEVDVAVLLHLRGQVLAHSHKLAIILIQIKCLLTHYSCSVLVFCFLLLYFIRGGG